MSGDGPGRRITRETVEVPGGAVEVFVGGPIEAGAPIVSAAHPAAAYGEAAVDLLVEVAAAGVVCVNPTGIGGSTPVPSPGGYGFESMVDDLDAVRRRLGINRWVFWGMSGGGWLGLQYACSKPDGLAGVILESACACFRARLADPACILSPFHGSWRSALDRQGLIERDSHAAVGDAGATEWIDVEGVGAVFRRRNGPALLVSPMPVAPEMRAAMPLLWTADFRNALEKIATPTLVIGGALDAITPLPHVRFVHGAIAGSRFLTVEGAAHVPTTARRPEVANAVRTFLQDCWR